MDIADIRDRSALDKWLRGRPRGHARILAIRSALRVFTLFSSSVEDGWAVKRELTALSALQLLIYSIAVQRHPSLEFAANITDFRTTFPRVDDGTIGSAYSSYFSAARIVADPSLAIAAAAAAARAYGSHDEIWEQLREDARMLANGEDLFGERLWSIPFPEWFAKTDLATRKIWQKFPRETWDFWLRWWDGVLSGNQVNWDLQRDIVLELTEEDWQAGPVRVAERIAEIEGRYQKSFRQTNLAQLEAVIAENPYAWRISFDVRSQTFTASAIEKRDLSEIVASVRASIRRLNQRCKKMGIGNFGQSVQLAFDPVLVYLKSDVRDYAASPLSLLVSIERARNEMEDIARKEQFITESFLTRFFLELQSAGEDICVAAPEIVEQLKKKAAVRFELYTLERKQQMMAQTFGLHLSAEGILKSVALESLRILGDDAAAKEDKQQAWYFATAVLPRAARAYLAETADADEAPAPPPKSSIAKRVVDAADALSKLDKGKDALIENVPALADLVQSIVDSLPPA